MSLPFGDDNVHDQLKNFWESDTTAGGAAGLPGIRSYEPEPVAIPIGAEPIRPPEDVRKVRDLDRSQAGESYDIDDLLHRMLEKKGSDLHLSAGFHPAIRVHGDITPLTDFPLLTGAEIERLVYSMLSAEQNKRFGEALELDFAYNLVGASRFRVNVLKQKEQVGAVMRTIPYDIKPLEALGISPVLNDFAHYERGLVLVTGPTGSGKSTTLAAIVDKANRSRKDHILTIEDPVEFVHPHKQCIVNQREVGTDTHSFAEAMKHALREDPDIILVGELRDLETISLAISLAETGHLVFGTLHTQSAPQTISRIIDVFPADQQAMVQTQLAETIKAVVCQTLVKTADGQGRQAALEIMIATDPIKANIRDNKLDQIAGYIQTGKKYGMSTMDEDLMRLVKEKRIRPKAALEKAHRRKDMLEAWGGEAGIDRMEATFDSPRQRFA